MKILEFNTEKGFYLTKLNNLETETHSHPAIEILYTDSSSFSVYIDNQMFKDIRIAIIDSNIPHKISIKNSSVNILLIENKDKSVHNVLKKFNIKIDRGYFISSDPNNRIDISNLLYNISSADSSGYDERVLKAIKYMDVETISYKNLVKNLVEQTNISESRLSHLFKQNTGVSLKKYFVWSRLKKVVSKNLNAGVDLFSAMIDYGFYDQAHFSKSYKSMIGVNPSKIYNSRILQR